MTKNSQKWPQDKRRGQKGFNVTQTKERYIVPILGIGIDSTHKGEVLTKIKHMLASRMHRPASAGELKSSLIVTPNPEIIMLAQKDHKLKKILNSASLALPDGTGLKLAQFILGSKFNINTVPGRIVFQDIINQAGKNKWKIFLLGAGEALAEELAERYQKQGINAMGTSGFKLSSDGKPVGKNEAKKELATLKAINTFKPDFLFVAFGAPKQEKWLHYRLNRLNCKIAMTVGGTFDYYSGQKPLPPDIFAKLGLEWLWRLITQPTRFPRIFTAVIKFPIAVFLWRLKNI